MKKIIYAVIGITLVVLGFSTYWFFYRSNSSQNTTQQETINATAEKGTITQSVSASGQIETANYLPVTTSVNGIVKEVFVKEGDSIIKGEKIMEITLNSEGEESLASARASYLSAKTSLEKAKTDLISKETTLANVNEDFRTEKRSNSYQTREEKLAYQVAENNYQVAQQSYDQQKESITQAEIALSKAWLTYQAQSPTITAPGSGTIANIVVVEGMDITNSLSERTSATVASIRKEGTPIATLNITEVDINKIQVGQKVRFSLNSLKDRTFDGAVVGIDKIGTSSSGVSNYPVIVKFAEESNDVLPNMGVDAEIIVQEKQDVIYVPASAIISMRGETVVRVQNDDKVNMVPVEIGITTNQYTEIISGLDEGSIVFINALPTSGFTSSDNTDNSRGAGGLIFGGSGGRR